MTFLLASLVPAIGGVQPAAGRRFVAQFIPVENAPRLFANMCGSCHRRGRAEIDLDEPADRRALRRDPATWTRVLHMLQTEQMPPARFPQPSTGERQVMIQWIEQEFAAIATERASPLVARRLRQTEYRNAVRDLLSVDWQPPIGFPTDDRGWDLAPSLPEMPDTPGDYYQDAARAVLEAVDIDQLLAAAVPQLPPSALPRELAALPPESQRAGVLLLSAARRAYRRALTTDESTRLVTSFVGASSSLGVPAALKQTLCTVLTSSAFLFCVEARCATEPRGNQSPCTEPELAARLASFLWNSIPDEPLLQLAEQGRLRHGLAATVKRMLADPRAQALAEGFAATWLELDRLNTASHVDDSLRRAMRRETEQLVATVLQEDRSVMEFLDADYSFLNETLAVHYGVPGVKGDATRRVSLAATQRRGLLTHGSMLALTSGAGVVSPVQRGKWVLDNVLGLPPPPPPAGLGAFDSLRAGVSPGSMREVLAQHRADSSCAECHAKIDALGFAFADFDARGAYRPVDDAMATDPIVLPDGTTLDGLPALQRHLLDHPEVFVRAISGKLLSYALGRRLQGADLALLDRLVPALVQEPQFAQIVEAIVRSAPMQTSRRDP
jgi:hypothetical protein